MKNIYLLVIIALLITTACETNVNTDVVDMKTVNKTITQLADNNLDAWNARDVDKLISMVADDGLFFGSDPSEIMNKKELTQMYNQLFADTATNYSYDIDMRKIIIAKDGKSAIVVEYFTIEAWSPLMPLRQTTQFVNYDNKWEINFIAWGLIGKNEDVEKLNKALGVNN